MNVLLTTLHSRYIHASLALPYLRAYCEPVCGPISIREFSLNQPKENILAQILSCQPDVVCFSVYLWNRILTLELVCCLKQINPELKIVLGGPEISYESDEFFSRNPVDAIICGEGEIPLRHLLSSWAAGAQPPPHAGLKFPGAAMQEAESLLDSLDTIPSPFALGLVDLTRGLVYYESSRGCPYQCSFCLSARSRTVRSFSMARIMADLDLLMQQEVKLVKFVDRTFNYESNRTREIFRYLLANNRNSSFHFEIGAHLLDQPTLDLLEKVPVGMFQFEIGVQSILPETLKKVSRKMSLELLAENVRALRERTRIHLHLDLVAGLPGEGFDDFLRAIDWTYALSADHLQIELVKLLPGAPLRSQAEELGIRYDHAPPYGVLQTPEMSFDDLERIRGIGRLQDLLVNSHKFTRLMASLIEFFGSLSRCLNDLDTYWRQQQLYTTSRSLRELTEELDGYLHSRWSGEPLICLRECLARDYAHNERVVGGSALNLFNQDLSEEEQLRVRQRVKQELPEVQRCGKVQYFSAVFNHLPQTPGRRVVVFLYVSKTATGLEVRELVM